MDPLHACQRPWFGSHHTWGESQMRRTGTIAVIALLLVALVGSSVAASPATTFGARAGVGEQGERMLVRAKVLHRVRGTSFSASAVVNFTSGPVTVELRRVGKSYVARLRVPVAADEAIGDVDVDVTITYGGVEQPVIHVTGEVIAPLPDDAP